MMKHRRQAVRAALGIAATATLVAGLTAAAPASATTAATASTLSPCKASPSNTNCNDVDPYTSGCSTDAYTVGWVAYDRGELGLGQIELRYSPSCKTNWSRWPAAQNQGWSYQMYVLRDDGYKVNGVEHYTGEWNTCTTSGCQGWVEGHTTDFWSPMIYSPTQRSQACVLTQDNTNPKYSICTPFM